MPAFVHKCIFDDVVNKIEVVGADAVRWQDIDYVSQRPQKDSLLEEEFVKPQFYVGKVACITGFQFDGQHCSEMPGVCDDRVGVKARDLFFVLFGDPANSSKHVLSFEDFEIGDRGCAGDGITSVGMPMEEPFATSNKLFVKVIGHERGA